MIVLYILLAIVILLFMILAHEFGHYIFGKILKFKINEFSVGFGPAIFSRTSKKTGEKFSLRLIPLGGYCAFDGEEDDKDVVKETAFVNQKPWKRIIVLLGGVTMNFITAIIFSWILLCTIGYDVPKINSFNTAYENPYQVGDVITKIDGETIDFAFGGNYVSLVNERRSAAKKQYEQYKIENGVYPTINEDFYTFTMTVKRDGKIEDLKIYVYPVEETDGNTGEKSLNCLIGLESESGQNAHTVAYVYNAWEGFCRSFEMAFGFAWVVMKSLWMLITFQVPISQVTGTIGTITTIATMASQSLSYLLIFIPLIAANLAVFNLLPIPALDGAHIVFVVIEWIRGKPINRELESKIHFAGLIVLFAFVVVIDILHFVL